MYGPKITFPRILPRKTLRLMAGDPVPLDDLRAVPITARRWTRPRTGSWMRSPRWSPSCARAAARRALRSAEPTDDGRFAVSSTPGAARVAVMGSGSWGTAFALVLSDARNEVTLWARRPELAAVINAEHRNADYFPTIALPEALRAVSDPQAAMDGADFVVLAVPSQSLRANLATWQIPPDAIVVSLAKGIELGTGLRMSQVIAEAGAIAAERIAVVTGPNLAREIAERQPSASVVASVALSHRGGAAGGLPHPAVPGVHQHRRGRLRARRGDQERHRPRRRDGHRARTGGQRDRLGDHPRTGRDQPAGRRARRRSRTPSPVWPGSGTWSPPARRRCRGTGPSVRSSGRGVRSPRSPPPPVRWPRE